MKRLFFFLALFIVLMTYWNCRTTLAPPLRSGPMISQPTIGINFFGNSPKYIYKNDTIKYSVINQLGEEEHIDFKTLNDTIKKYEQLKMGPNKYYDLDSSYCGDILVLRWQWKKEWKKYDIYERITKQHSKYPYLYTTTWKTWKKDVITLRYYTNRASFDINGKQYQRNIDKSKEPLYMPPKSKKIRKEYDEWFKEYQIYYWSFDKNVDDCK